MALKATIFKAELSLSDLDRHYFETHNLTIARHPSETNERMMIRILAFAMFASERLEFTKGLSTDDEPEIWQKDFSGDIETWIELGMPSEKRIRQACNRSQDVILFCYGGRTAESWWEKMKNQTTRFKNLQVYFINEQDTQSLSNLVERSMRFQMTLQDGEISLCSAQDMLSIIPEKWI